MLNKIVLAGHIWLPHFHFSLSTGRSQARRALNGAGNSVVEDHTGHCHQVRAAFSSLPTPCQALCQPRWHSSFASLPKPQPGQGVAPEHRVHAKVSKLSCLTHHQTCPTRAERREQGHKLSKTPAPSYTSSPLPQNNSSALLSFFSFSTRAAALPAQPGINRGAKPAVPELQRTIWTRHGLTLPSY